PMVDPFFVKGSPQFNPKVRQVTNNLKQAQKLIDQYTAQNGPLNLTFTLYAGGVAWGEPQAQQWSRLQGINIKLDIVPTSEGARRLLTGDWQMAVSGISGADPETFFNQLYSTSRSNITHYSNPAVDAALTQLRGETNPKKQHELYTTMSQTVLDD